MRRHNLSFYSVHDALLHNDVSCLYGQNILLDVKHFFRTDKTHYLSRRKLTFCEWNFVLSIFNLKKNIFSFLNMKKRIILRLYLKMKTVSL